MEKETLEEFIDRVDTPTEFDQFTFDEGIRVGAKWQSERMPIDILQRIISFGDASPELMETSFVEIYDKSKRWLEQFNKKQHEPNRAV